ncbi:MAG: hypothetical protein COA32_15585 [Fluviicola sp.]|nr:MAG: hypothetical protein COA32_15585 [Fluviicola sp.]
MKNKLLFIPIILMFLTATSCQKDLTGNAITIEANTNDTVTYFRIYRSCEPGSNFLPQGSFNNLNYLGNGNYNYEIEKGYEETCFTITGTIPENNDSTGKTTVNIDIFYTEEGNVVGFQDIELKRPHGEQYIRYEFRPDTYIE